MRTGGRYEKWRGHVAIGGHNLSPLVKIRLNVLQKSGGDCPPLVPTALLSLREISHKNRRNTVLENLDHPQAEQQLR